MDITPWLVGHSVPLVEMLDGREGSAVCCQRERPYWCVLH